MHVFVTGATGFVGRALVQSLLGCECEVTAWVRDVQRARQQLGPQVQLCPISALPDELARRLSSVDAVVNLAGENVLGGYWTAQRKRALRDSRVQLTRQLMAACRSAARPPRVIVSASAVGYYGDSADHVLREDSAAGTGFLAELCTDWERAALQARDWGARVSCLRIGIVLAADGGPLAAMMRALSMGMVGALGSGEQYVPWIHRDDLIAIILQALSDSRFEGPINCTAPEPVRSRELAATLARVLKQPGGLRLPAFVLRSVLGERAEVALQSQRAQPQALLRWGFQFQHPQLTAALAHAVARDAGITIRRASTADATPERGKPAYVLEQRTRLHVPVERAFAFFCRAENLGLITPSFMKLEILGEPPADMREGTEIDYRIALGPLPLRWKTIIRRWQPPQLFVDTQERGPYALWWHEHHLKAEGATTLMEDRVYFSLPLGWLGGAVAGHEVERTLRVIFSYRAEAIERIFGERVRARRELSGENAARALGSV